MAFPIHFLLYFLFLCLEHNLCHARSSSNTQTALALTVTKDDSTLQNITKISHGTPPVPTKLVIDLCGPFIWVDCASTYVSSSSIHQIPNRSNQCLRAKIHEDGSKIRLPSPRNPVDEDQSFQLSPENSITGTMARKGELVEDIMAIHSIDSSKKSTITTINHLLFSCAPSLLLNGLASGAKGMLGLGRTMISLPSQISDTFSNHRKFSLCLSSSKGVILLDDLAYVSNFRVKTLRSLTYTPLISNHGHKSSSEYFINVKSIQINGKRLALNTSLLSKGQVGVGGIKLSTIVPYTTMDSSIFATFTKAFVKAAAYMNMTVVEPVAPFGLCFNSKGINSTQVGPNVPVIDLVLQSEMVKWRIYGRNSMVQVREEVMCLGLLDGGLKPTNGIVIGGYQLEETLLQFDFGASMLGFSPSLLTSRSNCSDFDFNGIPKESSF